MDINIKENIISLFSDKNNFIKTILAFITLFIPVVNVIMIIILEGYYAQNTNTKIFKPSISQIDWWDFKNFFITGLKFIIFQVLIFIPLLIIVLLIFATLRISGFSEFFMILMFLLVALVIFGQIYYSSATLAFYTDLKFSSFFNMKAINYIHNKSSSKEYSNYSKTNFLICEIALLISFFTFGIGLIIAVPCAYLLLSDLDSKFLRDVIIKHKQTQ